MCDISVLADTAYFPLGPPRTITKSSADAAKGLCALISTSKGASLPMDGIIRAVLEDMDAGGDDVAEGDSMGLTGSSSGETNSERALRLFREGAPAIEWRCETHREGYQIVSTGAPCGDWRINFSGLVVAATLRNTWVLYEILGDDSADDIRFVAAELAPWISSHARGEACEQRMRRSWPRRDRLRLTRRDGSVITMGLRRTPPPLA